MASIIIFGGAGGIGSAIVRRLAARGDRPHLVGRDPAKLAAAAAAQDGALAGLVYAVGTINLATVASTFLAWLSSAAKPIDTRNSRSMSDKGYLSDPSM